VFIRFRRDKLFGELDKNLNYRMIVIYYDTN
jgi:hypothetical protein